jgi:hypothetical protein
MNNNKSGGYIMVLNATLVLVLFVAIRVLESVGRVLIKWIRRKYSTPKHQYFYKRITAIVTPELHAKLKAHVLLLNTTITDYILTAVTEKLKRESHG